MARVPPGPSCGAVVFLVHGTFADGALWPGLDQPAARAVAKAMPGVIVERFDWSGANSHRARAEAGRALAARFEESLSRGAGRLYAVGHSHGGNVILKALEGDRVAGRVRGIAFLGTPFLCATRRRTRLLVANFILAASLVLAFGGMFVGPRLEPLIGMSAALTTMLCAILAGGTLYLFRRTLRRKLNVHLAKAGAGRIALVRAPLPACPVLVATTPLDEAGQGLSVLDRLAAQPWQTTGRMAAAAGSLVVGWVCCSILIEIFGIPVDSAARTMAYWVLAGVFVGITFLTVPLALAVALVNWLSYGETGAAAAIAVRVVPQPLPPWTDLPASRRESFRPASPRWRGWLRLRAHHSFFYEDPLVLGRVADWLAEIDASPAAPGPTQRAKEIRTRPDDIARGWYALPGMLLLLAFAIVAVAERVWG